jgi:GDPmannose 4,6-dehydratase
LGSPEKARRQLGWAPTTTFRDLVTEMVAADVEAMKAERDRRNRHD